MERGTLRGGEYMGSISYKHLPLAMGTELKKVRKFPPGFSIVRTIGWTGIAGLITLTGHDMHSKLGVATGIAIGIAHPLVTAFGVRKSRQAQAEGAKLVTTEHSHPLIRGFLESGATHVVIGDMGNLHFYKSPKFRGKAFKPAFRGRRFAIQ